MGLPTSFRLAAAMLLAPTTVAVSGCGSEVVTAAAAPDSIAIAIERYVGALADSGSFSGVVLVADSGRIRVRKGFGFADAQWQIPNDPSAAFRIGSVTKQFTAAAVLLLQDRGRLHVTDPICRYLSPCPRAWRDVTIHHLLTHTSGIPDLVRLPGFGETVTRPTTLDETIERFRDLPLEYVPGSQFSYGNSGYVLAARIIERVTGVSYDDFLRDSLYGRAGMTQSGYAHHARVIPHEARGYRRVAGSLSNAEYIDMTIPIGAGSEYSTVDDLLRYDRLLYTDSLLSSEARAAMFTAHADSYGYGWEVGTRYGSPFAGHVGDINGYVAYFARYPARQLAVVVLSNLEGSPAKRMAEDIAAIFFTGSVDSERVSRSLLR